MTDLDNTSAAIGALQARVDQLESSVRVIDQKLDRLLTAANMGRGAWWALMKLGGLFVLTAGAAGWLYQQLAGGR